MLMPRSVLISPSAAAFLIIVLLFCVDIHAARSAKHIPAPEPAKADMLVGAYYFPGWCDVARWYCIAASNTAQHPLLGYYREGDPDAADWHIKWALEHGISFFAFDFYTANGSQMLEAALDEGFLKAKFIDRFKFCLNWCNHAEESTMTAEQLERFGDLVIRKYLTHPSYLKIDGKPVVIFLIGHAFIRNLGVDEAKKAFARFEERCKEAGLPGVYLVFCHDAMGPNEIGDAKKIGVNAFARYNYPYAGTEFAGPGKYGEATYEHLIRQGEELARQWRKLTGGAYWPTVMTGWDRRPWTKDQDLVRIGSSPELFARSLREMRQYVNKDRVVMIEAWNEWGEGSVLEPSVEYGFAYLDKVREVFCPNARPHKDADPKSLGLRQPVYDLKLPSADKWTFDFDAQGWHGIGVKGMKAVWGALVMTSENKDPQITSPITYLDCAKYSKAHIRMRAMPIDGTPSATGQLFWSTIDFGTCEDASVKFAVQLDGLWHDYDLDLSAHPKWRGRTDRFRFDPVDQEGIVVEIDEIALH